jgi:hypothetical protein
MKKVTLKQIVLLIAIATTMTANLSAQTFDSLFFSYPRASVNDGWYSTFVDINNDTLLDLIVREYPNGKLHFFVNNGSTLVPNGTIITPSYILWANPYDFDNDGLKDLLISFGYHYNCSANNIRIYWGRASSPHFSDNDYTNFALSSPYCVVSYPIDFNKDGLMDVFIENVNSPNLIYRNEGNRRFISIPTISTPRDLFYVADDFDRDGNMDLLGYKNGWADGLWGSYYYRGNGNGTFRNPIINLAVERVFIPYKLQANPLEDNWIDVTFNDKAKKGGSDGGTIYI